MSADPRIVLVPGGFTGAWMWADVVALLKREGIEALAVELPTIGEESAGADFYADAGDSMVSLMSAAAAQDSGAADEGVTVGEDGLAFLDREAARRALFNDCTPERAEEGLGMLRPMSLAGADQPVTEAAWRQLPSVYVRGREDRMPEAVASGFLERTVDVVELPAGHCPNWSRPDLVAELLAERARSITLE